MTCLPPSLVTSLMTALTGGVDDLPPGLWEQLLQDPRVNPEMRRQMESNPQEVRRMIRAAMASGAMPGGGTGGMGSFPANSPRPGSGRFKVRRVRLP